MSALETLINREFPIRNNWVYLRHAAVCPLPMSSAKAMSEYAFDYANYGNVNEKPYWLAKVEKAREQAAILLNCDINEIAFGKNTTWGLIVAALELPIEKGMNIVTPGGEFPANYYPWRPALEQGIELRYVPQIDHRLPHERLVKHTDCNTRVVSLSAIQYFSGFSQDLESLGRFCKEKSIYLVVDAIQSLGMKPFDTKKIMPSIVSADSHKWLLGPEGISLFYLNRDVLKDVKGVYTGWVGVEDPTNFTKRPQNYCEGARRYEEGAYNLAGIAAFLESLKLINQVGMDVIWKRISDLTDHLIKGLKSRNMEIISSMQPSERSGIVTFRPGCDAEKLENYLSSQRILVSLRSGCIRISPHFYNSQSDIDLLLDKIDEYKG